MPACLFGPPPQVRIFKHYELALHHPGIPLRRMSFSSYPGELSSDDDFYLLSTGLAVLQTTNSLLNASLYRQLMPQARAACSGCLTLLRSAVCL